MAFTTCQRRGVSAQQLETLELTKRAMREVFGQPELTTRDMREAIGELEARMTDLIMFNMQEVHKALDAQRNAWENALPMGTKTSHV